MCFRMGLRSLVLIAKSMPADNMVAHGFIDGAQAANEMVIQLKIRQLKSVAAPVCAAPRQ